MRKLTMIVSLSLATAMLSGCASPGGYPYGGYSGFGNTVSNHRGALAGAAIGGAGGALLGGMVSDSGNGALLGGAVGAAVGGLVGNSMDNKRRSHNYDGYDRGYRPRDGYGHDDRYRHSRY